MEVKHNEEVLDNKEETKADGPAKTAWSPRKKILFISMAYANFCLAACYALPAPFYPREAEKKGVSPTEYGLVFGVFELTNALMSPIYGKLMPILTPRFAVISGMFIAGSCSILFGFLDKCPPGMPFIVLSFCVRIFESMGATAYFVGTYGSIPIIFQENVGTSLAVIDTFYGVGVIAGSSIGGFLYQIGGYSLPFTSMGTLLLTGAILTFFLFPKDHDEISGPATSAIAIVKNAEFLLDLLFYFSGFLMIGFNHATLEPHLRQFNLEPYILGFIFMINALMFALLSPIWGYLIDKGVNGQILAVTGTASCTLCFLLIGPAPFLPFKAILFVVILSQVLLGVGNSMQIFCSYIHGVGNIVGRGFPDNVSSHALLFAMMNFIAGSGAFVGPSIGGILLEHTGYKMATLVMLCMELLVMAIFIVFKVSSGYQRKSTNLELQPVLTKLVKIKYADS